MRNRMLIVVGFLISLVSNLVAQPIEPGNWDRLRLYGHGSENYEFTEAQYEFIKDNYWLMTIEKTHGWQKYGRGRTEIGSSEGAERIAADNPDGQVLFYWNAIYTWSELYETVPAILAENPSWADINSNGVEVWTWPDTVSEDWWVNNAVDIVNSSDHTGVFVDGGRRTPNIVGRLRDALDGVVIYNGFGAGSGTVVGPEVIPYADGFFCEQFFSKNHDTAEKAILLMDALLEVPADKYMVCQGNHNDTINNQDYKFPLACFLIVANDYSFYKYQDGTSTRLTHWSPEYGYPLGEPYGPAIKQNNIYTRSFEFCDVVVDLNTVTHTINWHSGNPSGPNLALNKSTSQSSTTNEGVSSRAVDGNTSGDWSDGSVTHTAEEANAWWEVDLGVSQNISEIEIFNRSVLQSRLSDFTVSLIDSNGSITYTQSFSDYPDPSIAIDVGGAVGSVVRVQLNGTGILSLAEVEVHGFTNESPSFDTDTIVGASATEEVVYSDSLAGSVVDPDGDELSYSKMSGPAWLSIATDGALSGTPQASDVGENSWLVQVSDGYGGTDTVALNMTVVLAPGLVAYWPLDDASGAVASDLSGHEYNGTVTSENWVAGINGGALDFDGSDSLVSLPASAFASVSDQITISMWVYGDTTQPRNDSVIYATDASGNRILNIHLPWGNSSVYWDAGDSSGYDRISKTAASSEFMGTWNHWAFTKNATTGEMKIYLNGSLWHTGSGTVKTMSGITAAVLGSQISSLSYDGMIDDVKLYNVALDEADVADLYGALNVNGVSAFWLKSYDLDLTEAATLADSDDDGLTNLAEYLAGKDPLVNDSSPEIRVTEYYLSTGDFSGTSATVTLDQRIADDYFILVRGSRTGDDLSHPDSHYARITGVPAGEGELTGSGGWDKLILTRGVADAEWEGVVTVVECANSLSAAGFNLVDIVDTSLIGTSGTDTSSAWNDASQVVLFGGYRGGGASLGADVASRNQGSSVFARIYPTGTSTLNWSRDAAGEMLVDAEMTTFVVEWGSEWNVQHVNVAGSNGGNGADAIGEYTTSSISAVSRSNSWVWATGTRADAGVGDCAEACLITLGDGVNQNATESSVAVGSEYTDAYDFDVYVLTHSDISVDYRFVESGNQHVLDLPVAVDSAPAGARFGWSYNGLTGTGDYHPRSLFWARYTGDSEVTISRGFDGQNFPAWVQGVDFSNLND